MTKTQPNYLFLCGYPKSGTTLIATLLDGHPAVGVMPEETGLLEKTANDRITGEELIGWFLNESRSQGNLRQGRSTNRRKFDYSDFDFEKYSDLVLSMFRDTNLRAVEDAIASVLMGFLKLDGLSPKYVAEKTPGNECYLQKLVNWFPNLKAIYIKRDPRDVFYSYGIKRKKYPSASSELPLEEFVEKVSYSYLCAKNFATKHPDQILEITYEELTSEPRKTMANVAEFLKIEFEEILLQPTRYGMQWTGNSMHQNSFEAIKPGNSRWKDGLKNFERKTIERILGLQMGGYQTTEKYGVSSLFTAVFSLPKRRLRILRNALQLRSIP